MVTFSGSRVVADLVRVKSVDEILERGDLGAELLAHLGVTVRGGDRGQGLLARARRAQNAASWSSASA